MLGEFEGVVTSGNYARLAKCSADTALRDIREMLGRGILVQNAGGGRSTSYRLGEPAMIDANLPPGSPAGGGRQRPWR